MTNVRILVAPVCEEAVREDIDPCTVENRESVPLSVKVIMTLITKIIEEQLKFGGLVVANRGSGKTTALVNVGVELSIGATTPRVLIVACTEASKNHLQAIIGDLSIFRPKPIVVSTKKQFEQEFKSHMIVLVDEYFYTWYEGDFFAAVGTPSFPIHLATFISENSLHTT